VSARKFAKTEVDVFDETIDDSVISNYKDAKATTHSEKINA
jgi:MFS transporter, SP family, general alpha glucoside:H+ symporter